MSLDLGGSVLRGQALQCRPPSAESRETVTSSLLQMEELKWLKKSVLQERKCYCQAPFVPQLSPSFFLATAWKISAEGCVLLLLLLLRLCSSVWRHCSPLCIQGRMSKASHPSHIKGWQNLPPCAGIASPKKRLNKLNKGVQSSMSLGQAWSGYHISECSAEEQVKGTLPSKLTLLICMVTGEYRSDREKLFPQCCMLKRQKYVHIWLPFSVMSEAVVK